MTSANATHQGPSEDPTQNAANAVLQDPKPPDITTITRENSTPENTASFEAVERELAMRLKKQLFCPKCGAKGNMQVAGLGGSARQGEIRLIQLICKNSQATGACGHKPTLRTVLEHSNLNDELKAYETKYNEFQDKGIISQARKKKSGILGMKMP